MLLKELCTFLPKSKIKAGSGLSEGLYQFFTSSDIKRLFLNDYLYDTESVILGTGGTASCNYCNGKFATSTDNFVLKTSNKLRTKYLYYFLRKDELAILNKGFKGSGLKHISKAYVEQIDVPLKSIEEQDEIIRFLDRINDEIEAERKSLDFFNALIKSRFIEMFGDIQSSEKGFKLTTFGGFTEEMHIGPFGSDLKNNCFVPKQDDSVMVYEQKHAIQKSMDVPTRYISNEKFKTMSHFIVGPRDILVSCRGTLGESYVIPENAPIGVIHPSLMLIKVKKEYDPHFLIFFLDVILKEQDGRGSGVKMSITANELSKKIVINPPKEMIGEFMNYVELIDKLKFSILYCGKMQ